MKEKYTLIIVKCFKVAFWIVLSHVTDNRENAQLWRGFQRISLKEEECEMTSWK
jgi:hypothetical protein